MPGSIPFGNGRLVRQAEHERLRAGPMRLQIGVAARPRSQVLDFQLATGGRDDAA
jgi:hypothetical protein